MTDSTLSHTRHTDGKGGAAAATAAAVRGRSSDCPGGRCSVGPCRSAPSAQGRASGQGARRKRPPGGGAGKRGDASVSHAAKRTVTARWVTGLESSQHPTLANDVGAGRLRRGRGKAELAGAPSAGGELSRTHVCERMPSHLITASPRRCIVWLPRLNRSATVGSSTCTLTKCGYLSVVDVACEIQYRRPSDSNLRG